MSERVLVVDDDEEIRASLRRGLAGEGYTVELAADGEEALRRAREEPPDLVVLDLGLPGLDGLEVCRRLRTADEGLPIVMLTARDAVSDRVAGLEGGADDYLVKPFAFEELLARIRVRLRRREGNGGGNGSRGGRELRFADLRLDTAERVARRGDRRIVLTTTEYELLRLFMQHPREVLTRDRIYERVWGYDYLASKAVRDGADDYLVKPFANRSLRNLVERWIGPSTVTASCDP